MSKSLSQLVMMGSKHGIELKGKSYNCLLKAAWQMLIMISPDLIASEEQASDINFPSCTGTMCRIPCCFLGDCDLLMTARVT